MAKLSDALSRKLSEDEVTLEVDLVEMFGGDVPDSTSFRQQVGQAIIDKIRERTEGGDFLNAGAKKTYSDEYADSIDFKAYGKSQGDVNLSQTGDMLGLLDIIDEKSESIVLGWNDDTNNAKAFNHTTGDTVPRRDFFGLPQSDIDSIVEMFADELPQNDETFKDTTELTEEFITSKSVNQKTLGTLLKDILGDDDEF